MNKAKPDGSAENLAKAFGIGVSGRFPNTRKIDRWNPELHAYVPTEVPMSWYVTTYEEDMEKLVNCPGCGKQLKVGEGYTSRQWHTPAGMGYCVCPKCYEAEWEAEKKAAAKQAEEE